MNRINLYFITLSVIFLLITCENATHQKQIKYYDNGNIKSEIWAKDHVTDGPEFHYFPNGSVKVMGISQEGFAQGKMLTYYPDGKLELIGEVKNTHTKNNYWTRFYQNGKLKSVELYDNDSLLFMKEFDSLGNFTKEFRKIIAEPLTINVHPYDTFFANVKVLGLKDYDRFIPVFFNVRNEQLSEVENKKVQNNYTLKPMLVACNDSYNKSALIKVIPYNKGKHTYSCKFYFIGKDQKTMDVQVFCSSFICE